MFKCGIRLTVFTDRATAFDRKRRRGVSGADRQQGLHVTADADLPNTLVAWKVLCYQCADSRFAATGKASNAGVGHGVEVGRITNDLLAVHLVGWFQRHPPVDLAKSGVNEAVDASGFGVIVQALFGRVLDLVHDRGDDLGHSLRPADGHGPAGELADLGIAQDCNVGAVANRPNLGIPTRFTESNTR